MTILFEVTIQVRNLVTKLLFPQEPSLGSICRVVEQVFADNEKIADGMVSLILSVGDGELGKDTVLEVGDEITFSDDTGQIGFLDVQTRTLFDVT